MNEEQISLDGRRIEGRFWKYEGRKANMTTEQKDSPLGDGGDVQKTYPPAVFMRVSKAGTSLYGFVPDEGIKGGKSLVMNRADLIKLLKGEVEFVKVGILKPAGKKETTDTDGLEG